MKKSILQIALLLLPFFTYAQIIKYSQTFSDEEGTEFILEYERVNNTAVSVFIEKPGVWRTLITTGPDTPEYNYNYFLFDDEYIYSGHFQNVFFKLNKENGEVLTNRIDSYDGEIPSSTGLYLEWLSDEEIIAFSKGTVGNERIKAFILDKNIDVVRTALVPDLSNLPNSIEIINCSPNQYIEVANVVLDYNLNTIAIGSADLTCSELDALPSIDGPFDCNIPWNQNIDIYNCENLLDTILYRDTFYLNGISDLPPFENSLSQSFEYQVGVGECEHLDINYFYTSTFDTIIHTTTICQEEYVIEYGSNQYIVSNDTTIVFEDSLECGHYYVNNVSFSEYTILEKDTIIDFGDTYLGEMILQDTVLVDSSDIDNCLLTNYNIFANYNAWTIHGSLGFCLDSDINIITIEADSSFAGYEENQKIWSNEIEIAPNLKDKAREIKLSDNGFGYYLDENEEIMTVDFPNGVVEGSGKMINYGILEDYYDYDFYYDGNQFLAYNAWSEFVTSNNVTDELLWMRVFNDDGFVISEEVQNLSWTSNEIEEIDFEENGTFVISVDLRKITSLNDSSFTNLTINAPPKGHLYIDKSKEVYYAVIGEFLLKYNFDKERWIGHLFLRW